MLVKNKAIVRSGLLLCGVFLLVGCLTTPPKVDSVAEMPVSLLGTLQHAAAISSQRGPLVAVAPDASCLGLILSNDDGQGRLTVWSLPDERLRWDAEVTGLQSVRFGKSTGQLLTAHTDGFVRLWDAKTGERSEINVGLYRGKQAVLYDAIFGPDDQNNIIAVVGQNGLVGLWDTIQKKWLFSNKGHQSDVLHAVFFEEGKKLLTLDEQQFCFWSIGENKDLSPLQCVRHEDADPKSTTQRRVSLYQSPLFNNLVATLSPDEQLMILSKSQGIVQVWDLQKKTPLTAFQQSEHVPFVFFSADGRWIVRFQQTHFALNNGSSIADPTLVVEDVHMYRNQDGTLHFERNNVRQQVFRGKPEHWLMSVRGWPMLIQGEVDRAVLFDPMAPRDKIVLGPHVLNGTAWVLSKELPSVPQHAWVKPAEPKAELSTSHLVPIVYSREMGADGKPRWVVDAEKGILRGNNADKPFIQLDSLRGARRVLVAPNREKEYVLVMGDSDAQLFEVQTAKYGKKKSPSGIRLAWKRTLVAPSRYSIFLSKTSEILWVTGTRVERINLAKGNLLDSFFIGEKEEIQLVDHGSRSGWIFILTDNAVWWRSRVGGWKFRRQSSEHFSVHAAGIVLGNEKGNFLLVDPVRNVDKATWMIPPEQEVERLFLSGNGKLVVIYSSKSNKMTLWQLGNKESVERGTFQLDQGDLPKQVRFLQSGRLVEVKLISGKIRWTLPSPSKQKAPPQKTVKLSKT